MLDCTLIYKIEANLRQLSKQNICNERKAKVKFNKIIKRQPIVSPKSLVPTKEQQVCKDSLQVLFFIAILEVSRV